MYVEPGKVDGFYRDGIVAMNTRKLVLTLIEKAQELGLPDDDIATAVDLLEHREYALALDTVITQLDEYEISIHREFYQLVIVIAENRQLPEDDYLFLKLLVKDDYSSHV